MRIKNAIPHPRTMGVIRESGGKMHMAEKEFAAAQQDFFQAFRNYDEAGSGKRIQVLKYLVLAHMLTGNEINPFDSQETKPYQNDPNIVAMTSLVDAYQRRDIHEAERIVRGTCRLQHTPDPTENHSTLTDDPFVKEFISDVLKGLRIQFLVDLVRPYGTVTLSSLAGHLHIGVDEVEALLMMLILDGRIQGRMDQVSQVLELKQAQSRRNAAAAAWSEQLRSVATAVAARQGTSYGRSAQQLTE